MIPDRREGQIHVIIDEVAAVIHALANGGPEIEPPERHAWRWLFARCPRCRTRIWAAPWLQADAYRSHYILTHVLAELRF